MEVKARTNPSARLRWKVFHRMNVYGYRNTRSGLPSSAMGTRIHSNPCHPERFRGRRSAFTLVELLVVIAIIAILAGLLLPALARAKEKAKVAKVHAELYGVGLALEMYADDHAGQLPPVRVNCNSDFATHWCQFPVELADEGYLPRGTNQVMAAHMEDVFNRGHTYKYATPGPQLLNGSAGGNYRFWAPDDFPACASDSGRYYSSRTDSPVRWVLWSLGPRPNARRRRIRALRPPTVVGIGVPETVASSSAWRRARGCSSKPRRPRAMKLYSPLLLLAFAIILTGCYPSSPSMTGPSIASSTSYLEAAARDLLGDHITVLGENVGRIRGAALAGLRRRIGYVPQLLPARSELPLTVREVVAIGRTARAGLFHPLSREDWQTMDYWIDRLGLFALADRAFSQISGGEQRKTIIARAMAQQPELLLLDEPNGESRLGLA